MSLYRQKGHYAWLSCISWAASIPITSIQPKQSDLNTMAARIRRSGPLLAPSGGYNRTGYEHSREQNMMDIDHWGHDCLVNAMFHYYVQCLSSSDGWYDADEILETCVVPILGQYCLVPPVRNVGWYRLFSPAALRPIVGKWRGVH